ncbi:MAG: EAL domain-containing protein [Burkholderiales bacterium]
MLRPDRFIQVADETGLILDIGDWVLDGAIAQARAWNGRSTHRVRVGVNISARQFSLRLVDQVRGALERHGLEPALLELDVSEATLMQNLDESRLIVDRLRELGANVVVDDFGTGYSSMQYLRRLAVSAVKIDMGFIRDVVTSRDDRVVVKAIIDMARNLGIGVIAEGTETPEQLEVLRGMECREYSGNLYSPPVPAVELERLLLPGSNVLTLAAHRAPG